MMTDQDIGRRAELDAILAYCQSLQQLHVGDRKPADYNADRAIQLLARALLAAHARLDELENETQA